MTANPDSQNLPGFPIRQSLRRPRQDSPCDLWSCVISLNRQII